MATLIAFRVDASLEIGTGHVMRCLALANELNVHGARCVFVTRPFPGHLNDIIRHNGHYLVELPMINQETPGAKRAGYVAWLGTDWATDASQTLAALGGRQVDWVVVDHYALDAQWEAVVASGCGHVMAIDDLANRKHECDLLLDQNLGRFGIDYKSLVKPGTELLIGPKYALLRPEFSKLRGYSISRRKTNSQLRRLIVTLGGIDQKNITEVVLREIAKSRLSNNAKITVVMGPSAPWLENVRCAANNLPIEANVLAGVNNMAELMAESDLAIGAAGSTSWERCCLGLPTIQLVMADNQIEAASALQAAGAAISLEEVSQLGKWLDCVTPKTLSNLSKRAVQICDGQGASLVREIMLKSLRGLSYNG